jgi:type IV secretory pathway VirB10-like protein
MDNLATGSGSLLAAFDDWGILIFVIIAILSNLFGSKKKQQEEEPWEPEEQSPPQPEASPSNLEEELRRLLSGGSDKQPAPPVEEPLPPVLQSASPAPEPQWEPEPVVETTSPLHEAREAYQQASQLHESVAERMEQVHTHSAAPAASTDAASGELREVITMVRQPKTARQAIVASVILGSPKGLEI